MGWTERRATHYKRGVVDRKAELIDEFTCHNDNASWEVLKCSMVGSVGYMAIKYTDNNNPEKNHIFGYVCLTSVSDRHWFAYKNMDESMNPYYYDCPKSIINLLSPTDNEWANEWRQKCLENKVDSMKKELSQAKEGSIIKVTYKYDTNLAHKGDVVTFMKKLTGHNYRTNRSTYQWVTTVGLLYRMSPKMILDNNPEWVEFVKK